MGNSQANSISTSSVEVEEKDPSPNSFAIVLPNDPSRYSVIDLPSSGFKWTIKKCRRLKKEMIVSEIFDMGGYKWFLCAYPSKSNKDELELYLKVADYATLPDGWSINAKYSLAVVNQVDDKLTVRKSHDSQKKFTAGFNWGWGSFMSLANLFNPAQGFMVNDSIIVKAHVAVCRNVEHDSKDESSLELSSMKELRKTAMIYYNKVPLQVRNAIDHFFDALDFNNDGKVSFIEFSHFMKGINCESLNNPSFFEELSTEKSKELNINDMITLYYILKSGRPICDGCRRLTKGLFFTCETCFINGGNSFNLHPHCLDKDEFIHNHVNFIDTFTLLSFTRMKLLANQNATNQIKGNPRESSSSISPVVLNELSDNLPSSGFKWTIKNCTRLKTETIESEIFYMGGYKWFLYACPNKSIKDKLSLYLKVADSAALPYGWSINAKYSIAVVNQVDDELTLTGDSGSQKRFGAGGYFAWGWDSFMSLVKLFDSAKGFMVNDSIIVKAYVAVCRNVEHDSKDEDESSLELSSIRELRRTTMIYYNKLPLEVMVAINQIFDKMDINKDGKVSFLEFSHLMLEIGNELLNNPSFFEELSTEISNELNRIDVITLYYILKSGRPICDGCRRLTKGLFFTCATCFSNGGRSFNLHPHCLDKEEFIHNHANFIDTFTLLSFTRMKLLANQNAAKQIEDPLPNSLLTLPGEAMNENWTRTMTAWRVLQQVAPVASSVGSLAVNVAPAVACTIM